MRWRFIGMVLLQAKGSAGESRERMGSAGDRRPTMRETEQTAPRIERATERISARNLCALEPGRPDPSLTRLGSASRAPARAVSDRELKSWGAAAMSSASARPLDRAAIVPLLARRWADRRVDW